MRIRNINGCEYGAHLTTEHAASSYGQPVVVSDSTGEAVDKFSAACSTLIGATDEERVALTAAGYHFGDKG